MNTLASASRLKRWLSERRLLSTQSKARKARRSMVNQRWHHEERLEDRSVVGTMLFEIGALLDKEHFLGGILPKAELNMLLAPVQQSPLPTTLYGPVPDRLPVWIVPSESQGEAQRNATSSFRVSSSQFDSNVATTEWTNTRADFEPSTLTTNVL